MFSEVIDKSEKGLDLFAGGRLRPVAGAPDVLHVNGVAVRVDAEAEEHKGCPEEVTLLDVQDELGVVETLVGSLYVADVGIPVRREDDGIIDKSADKRAVLEHVMNDALELRGKFLRPKGARRNLYWISFQVNAVLCWCSSNTGKQW